MRLPRRLSVVLPLLIGLCLWFVPHPSAVDARAWHLLAIFMATIMGIMLKPLPGGAVAILGMAMTALTGTLTIEQALSGFGNRVIWLIVIAFFISRGFMKTGLGPRIAYLFMRALGRKTLGLAYGMVAADLVLSPAIPSNTARAGGVIFPILRSIARTYGSEPHDGTALRIGAFLMKTSFQGTVITSALFLTAMAGNALAVQLAAEMGVGITWVRWALAAVVPGLLSLLTVPWFIYRRFPPEIKETPEAVAMARRELETMGQPKAGEWVMMAVFLALLVFWIFGYALAVHPTTAALSGLGILLGSRVLTWQDILSEKEAWNTLVWFSALVMMATYLNELGLLPWLGRSVSEGVRELGWIQAFLILGLVYFYSHYFFASNTAHISAMYAPFLAAALAVGAPPLLAALVLAFFSNLFSSTTHYGTGPAPVFFGSGYVEMATWWKLGFQISLLHILIWVGIGGAWWKLLRLW